MTTVTTNGHAVFTGVIPGGDSHHGHYVTKAVIQMAINLGWKDKQAIEAVEQYDGNYYRDGWPYFHDIIEISVEAQDWLNENTEGGIWDWSDGDFRVDAIEPCPHCGADRYTDRNIDPYSECPDHLGL